MDIKQIYDKIRNRARQIVSHFPSPEFYTAFSVANDFSRNFFATDLIVIKLRSFISENIKDNLGHGIDHANKVSIDAGTLLIIEGNLAGYSEEFIVRRLLLVQCAGLLHDIKRAHKNHAEAGAIFAKEVLKEYSSIEQDEVEDISKAIRNHEAFRKTVEMKTSEGVLISDCLYDADKFRWGPDNFTHTVWDMVSLVNLPLKEFIALYPNGIEGLVKIRNTFRTSTGKKYGPQFIDTGLAIGKELNRVIKTEFAKYI